MNPSPSYRRYLFYGGLLILFILQIPAIAYALATPFALIDDYNSWYQLRDQSTLSGNLKWLHDIFFNFTDVMRFRPTYDFYQLVTWAGFGPSPGWHHLARLLLKASIAWYGARTLRLCSANGNSRSAMFLFFAIYFFYPNCPEARLAPVEMTQTLFLAAMIFYLLKLHVEKSWGLQAGYFKLLFVYWMLSWSKETSIGFLLGAIVAMLPQIKSVRRAWLLAPFILIFIFLLLKIRAISHGAGYGAAPLTGDLIKANLAYYPRALLLWDTSAAITISFCALIVTYLLFGSIHRTRPIDAAERIGWRFTWLLEKQFFCSAFVFALLLGYLLLSCTFWLTVVRYFYPAVFLLALLSALCIQGIEQGVGTALSTRLDRLQVRSVTVVAAFTAVFGLYFIGANYYNFLYQYAAQYHNRIVEQQLLAEVSALRTEKKSVYVRADSEFEEKIQIYFNEFLPFFYRDQDKRVVSCQSNQLLDEGIYFVTRHESAPVGHALFARVADSEQRELILRASRRASALLQFSSTAFTWTDAGAAGLPGMTWFIYHNNLDWGNSSRRSIIADTNILRVPGGKPYAESGVSIPEFLLQGHAYLLTLKYQTKGAAKPFVIILPRPNEAIYPLHDTIPLAPASTRLDLPFGPEKDCPSPLLLVRNWSDAGEVEITQLEVSELLPAKQ